MVSVRRKAGAILQRTSKQWRVYAQDKCYPCTYHKGKQICGAEVWLHSFLISVLYGSQWSISSPGRFTPGKEPWYPQHSRLCGYQIRSGAESIRKVKPKQKGLKLN